MQRQTTLTALLAAGADDATALHAPGGAPLSYRALRAQVARTIATLNALGIGRGDRVAIVLPNGPEMAAAFVGIAAGCASCPLNPAYRTDEFEFYLADLNAKALVVERGSSSPAIEVARKAGVRLIELVPGSEGSGSFTLSAVDGAAGTASAHGGPSQADDVALILHTSGTTSRPKIVPLTQANICASAYNIVETLQLTAADRALNIMPLFHIHGLMAGTLAPLAAGSTIFCTQGFNALKFFAQMAECKPTWYTAVPTMHQTILARAPSQQADHRRQPAALPALVELVDPAAGDRRTGGDLQRAADRELRHDRSLAPDGEQPAATGPRKPGTVGRARRTRDRDHGRGG
jgi:oxalate---CoA ligase